MTNEQAIKHLEDLQRLYLGNDKFTLDIEALEIAINAIKLIKEEISNNENFR